MSLAPILLFTYKKVAPVKKVVAALQKNFLAKHSELIIFSDGPRREADSEQVNEVRKFLETVKGFKSIKIHEAPNNMGLAKSIITGVTKVFEEKDRVIVLEDDLVTSHNFLNFMNQALNEYEFNLDVHSISGYTMPITTPKNYEYDSYCTMRASSWGWATWKDRWEAVDWEVKDYPNFKKDSDQRRKFNAMGSDLSSMLAQQMEGKISSWAIRWCYDQFKKKQLTVFPTISKVSNIGFGDGATHTKYNDDRFSTYLDKSEQLEFNFQEDVQLDDYFIKQFRSKYSLRTRAFYKLKNILGI